MNKEDIELILRSIAQKRTLPLDLPTQHDWDILRAKFNCEFDEDFITFMQVVSFYHFPGELYDVADQGEMSEDGSIAAIYDLEMSFKDDNEPQWRPDLIPFNGVANGDCYCLSANEGAASSVYYVYHEDGHSEKEYDTFEQWLKELPQLI